MTERPETTTSTLNSDFATDFAVADLSLADWGRKEIKIAETEMPDRRNPLAL